MGKISLLCLFLLNFLLQSCNSQSESSTTVELNRDATIRHWNLSNGSLPLTLALSDGFSSAERDAINLTLSEWNSSPISATLLNTPLSTTPNLDPGSLSTFRDGTLGIYKIENWFSEVDSSALAVTQFFAYPQQDSSGVWYYEIVHADILINYRDHQFSIDPDPYSFDYDLPSVVLHELGHLLGLGHVNDMSIPSVMHPTLSPTYKQREIFNHDEDEIVMRYTPPTGGITSILPSDVPKGELVRGIIELHANGHCKEHFTIIH